MKADNPIKVKSKQFAIRIVRLYQHLGQAKQEYVMSKQVLRSGTSVGANVAEGMCAQSKKDFLAKLYIAFKECVETQYWLELLYETDYLTQDEFQSMNEDCEELRKLLSSITKTTAQSLE